MIGSDTGSLPPSSTGIPAPHSEWPWVSSQYYLRPQMANEVALHWAGTMSSQQPASKEDMDRLFAFLLAACEIKASEGAPRQLGRELVQVCVNMEANSRAETLRKFPSSTASRAWARRAFDKDWSYLQWNAPNELPSIPYWIPLFLQRVYDDTTSDLRTYQGGSGE